MQNILIVVDMQQDFISGALGSNEAKSIIPKACEVISAQAKAGDKLIFTLDTHADDYLNTPEGKKLPVPHCIKGTEGHKLQKEIAALYEKHKAQAITIEKPTFGFLNWEKHITDGDGITLIGVCTDICVISNALILKAAFPNSEISVISSACAGVTPATHASALTVMKSCQINIF